MPNLTVTSGYHDFIEVKGDDVSKLTESAVTIVEPCHIGRLVIHDQAYSLSVLADDVVIDHLEIRGYVRGCYVGRGIKNFTCKYYNITVSHKDAKVAPGHNGILVEGSRTGSPTNNINFLDGYISDAGEHGIRFGRGNGYNFLVRGAVENCGGCGVKVRPNDGFYWLNGNFQVATVDSGTNQQGYNQSAFRLENCKNINLNSCSANRQNKKYSCSYGVYLDNVDGIMMDNIYLSKCGMDGVLGYARLGRVANVYCSQGLIHLPKRYGVNLIGDRGRDMSRIITDDNFIVDQPGGAGVHSNGIKMHFSRLLGYFISNKVPKLKGKIEQNVLKF